MKIERDPILDRFLAEIHRRFGANVKQVILFGSRAREDYEFASDYDCLVIVEEVTPAVNDVIDEIAGELLYQYGALFSIFPIPHEKYQQASYDPFLMNVRQEGIVL